MEKLNGKTFDVVSDNIKKLQELFPEIVTEGKVDVDKLALLFDKGRNEDTEGNKDGEERYEFTWKGKKEALRMAQKQTTGTLRPCKEESVNFDETQNLYIEGDNLEVLRALQSSYRGKIKMIYIDPPYNTGNDFIYKDDFSDNVKNYKETMHEAFKTNTDNSGRYHTNWLNMMYSRLKLAKNLLTEDGAIFVSIDDNEVDNLKKILDEIFGEINFVGRIMPIVNPGGRDYKQIALTNEYLLVYSRSAQTEIQEISKDIEFKMNDILGGYELRDLRNRNPKFHSGNRPNLFYPFYINENIKDKYGCCSVSLEKGNGYDIEVKPYNSTGKESVWRWGKVKSNENIELSDIDESQLVAKPKRDGGWTISEKNRRSTTKVKSVWDESEMRTEEGTRMIRSMFNFTSFDHPKPLGFIKRILEMSGEADIVLDFFSGSATTAHATMQLNAEDGGNRKFIMVQLPEETDEKSEAYKAGYKTICEIGKERIRRAGKKIVEENKGKEGMEDLDIGFKVFKLDTTNIKEWDDTIINTDEIKWNVEGLINPIKDGRSKEDVIYEILLKYGVDLTMPIEEVDIMGSKVYSVGFGYLMICLEKDITLDLIEAIGAQKPNRVVLYDNGLDNESKTNGERILKELGVKDMRTI